MTLAMISSDLESTQVRRAELERLIRDQVANYAPLTRSYVDPMLVISERKLRDNARRFMAALPRVRPHFAVKANPDPRVLAIFKQEGTCFEVASIAELDAMRDLGVEMDTVFYSNPIKSPASVKQAARLGVKW